MSKEDSSLGKFTVCRLNGGLKELRRRGSASSILLCNVIKDKRRHM
jgi:hypothetical protein